MTMRIRIIAGVVAVIAAGDSAFAQSTSLFGNSGPRAQSSTASRSSSSGRATGGSMQSGAGGGGARAGGTGAGGAGGAGGGAAFQGPQLRETGDLSAQAVGRTGGFVGGASGGMVGDRMAGTTAATATQRPNFGALGAGRGSDFNSQDRPQQAAASTSSFRPQYRVGFEYTPSTTDISRRTASTVGLLTSRNPALSGLAIVVDDAGMAEIRGTAPTAAARKLIENVVRLEPGVRQVTNLVIVAPPAAANP